MNSVGATSQQGVEAAALPARQQGWAVGQGSLPRGTLRTPCSLSSLSPGLSQPCLDAPVLEVSERLSGFLRLAGRGSITVAARAMFHLWASIITHCVEVYVALVFEMF